MPSEVPARGWDAEIIIDEGEGQYIISELSPKYNDSPACPLSPRSELKGKTNMAVIPAMVPLQTFQMFSPAPERYRRTNPRSLRSWAARDGRRSGGPRDERWEEGGRNHVESQCIISQMIYIPGGEVL